MNRPRYAFHGTPKKLLAVIKEVGWSREARRQRAKARADRAPVSALQGRRLAAACRRTRNEGGQYQQGAARHARRDRPARVQRGVTDVSIDDLLAGALLSPRTCPHCGRAPDFEDEETVVEDRPREAVLKLVR